MAARERDNFGGTSEYVEVARGGLRAPTHDVAIAR
jgi:hypothetical protein